MCGITGFISNKSITLSLLKKMNDSLVNRGPNDGGEYL